MPIRQLGLRLAILALGVPALWGCAAQPKPPAANATTAFSPSPLGNYLAGRYARASQDTAAAAAFYVQALADDPSNPALLQRTFQLLVAAGRVQEGVAVARRLADMGDKDLNVQTVLAVAELKAGTPAAAVTRLSALPSTNLGAIVVPMMRSWSQLAAGDSAAALATIGAVADDRNLGQLGAYHLALMSDVAGKPADAERSYRRLLETNASAPPRFLEAFALSLAHQGRTEDARRVLEALLQRNPENQVALVRLRDLQKGAVPLTVPDAVTGVAETLFTIATLLTRDDPGEGVEFYLNLALYLRPQFDVARFLLADVAETRKDYDAAIASYSSIGDESPYYSSARVRQAWALNSKGQTDEAIAVLRNLANGTQSSESLIALADLLRSKERYAEAIQEYSRALALVAPPQQRHWSIFYSRAIAYDRSKQWPRAEADFLKALELQPDQPLVLNYLGYSWIDRGENLHRARAMVEKAVELRPNEGFIVDSLGWALYRLGEYQNAVLKLERAVELQPDDPVINDHLGDAYWRVGRRNEARFQWQRSLGLKPEPDARAVTERKLVQGLPAEPATGRAATGG
jgi:Flp pilus assembly protein TadD